MEDFYCINEPQIACDIINGEAVFIDFESGTYFSASGSGGSILQLIKDGHSVTAVIGMLGETYADFNSMDEHTVREFVERLEDDNLIVATPERQNQRLVASPKQTVFARPVLEKFEDLQDLLLLDPIHEVDPTGWPARKAA
jgi:hypothetical protein